MLLCRPQDALPAEKRVVIASFSRRQHNNMSLHYGDTQNALRNRINFLEPLGIDYRLLVCAKQVHSGSIRIVSQADKGSGALSYESAIADTDAFITDKSGLPLAIFTADCLSVFVYDPHAPAIGLVHAGWRSSKERILFKTIALMKERFNTDPRRICVAFGPAIRECCYEVGADFNDYFPGAVQQRGRAYYLDLIRVNKLQALEAGVQEALITDSGICTCCRNEDLFSYRKEGKSCGRMMSVVMLT